jgi:ABC-2 type transport system ATP-binding protein
MASRDTPYSDQPCAIQIRGLAKIYKSGLWLKPKVVHALNSLILDVYENQAFGLLGLNGAGKTTTIKLVLGLLKPTAGSISVLGGSIDSRIIRQKIGYLPELPYFSKQHTGREMLVYFGRIYGLSGADLHNRVDEVLELVRMRKAADQRISGYSRGMQQRIGIGQALIGKPRLLICDEPMSGLDPVGYKEMRDIFIDLKKSGTTIFLNTHILDEVERICDRVGILHDGELKDVALVSRIMESAVPVDYWIDVEPSESPKLFGMPFQDSVHQKGGVQVSGLVLPETLTLLTSRNAKVNGIRPLSSILEAYFLRAIGAETGFSQVKGGKP